MVRSIKLANGITMPILAFGTGSAGNYRQAQKAQDMATKALEVGFKHLDTAQLYLTEAATGKAVTGSSLKKDDIFVTSKLSNNYVKATTSEEIKEAVQKTIKDLGFIPDLFLIHNPFVIEKGKIGEAWKILEGLVEDGTLKGSSLGVSNFRPQDLKDVLEVAKIKPVVNQVEYHPYVLTHLEPIQKIQEEHGIIFQAYGPLTPLLRHPTGGPLKPILSRIAERLSKDTGEKVDSHAVLTLWCFAKGVPVVTASGNPDRLEGLWAIDGLPDLTKEEVEEIEQAGRKIHFRHYTEHMEEDFPLPDLPSDL